MSGTYHYSQSHAALLSRGALRASRGARPQRRRHGPPPLRPASVEVQGSEEGFFGSWYLARVSSIDEGNGVVTLRYTELLQEDGTAETETLRDTSRLRPPLARHFLQGGAKRPDTLSGYAAGDAVEVEYEEGWWEGYVAETHHGHVILRFDSNPGEVMKVDDPQRLRPGHVYDGSAYHPAPRHVVEDMRVATAGGASKSRGRAGAGGRAEGPGPAALFLPPFSSAGALYPPPLADSSMSSEDTSRSDGGAPCHASGIDAAEAAGQRALRAAAKAAAAKAARNSDEPLNKRRRTAAHGQQRHKDDNGADEAATVHEASPMPPVLQLQASEWEPSTLASTAAVDPPPADVAAAVAAACVRRSVLLRWRAEAMSAGAPGSSASDAAFAALRRRLAGALVRVHPPAQSDTYRLLHATSVGVHDRPYDCPPRAPGPRGAGVETIGLWLAGGPGGRAGAGSFRRLYRLVDVSDAAAPSPAEVATYVATHARPGAEAAQLARLRALAAQAAQPLLATQPPR